MEDEVGGALWFAGGCPSGVTPQSPRCEPGAASAPERRSLPRWLVGHGEGSFSAPDGLPSLSRSEVLASESVACLNQALFQLRDIWEEIGIPEDQRLQRTEVVKKHVKVSRAERSCQLCQLSKGEAMGCLMLTQSSGPSPPALAALTGSQCWGFRQGLLAA